ncbi:unnamed protein product [Rotaria sordida]|uniref:Uncharacterized protein n=1 Tax=Rotaria sordida TaxID=392033 RepID=A0A819WMW8_9BILA|nr:unnamed protein product [Rotaria sordida]
MTQKNVDEYQRAQCIALRKTGMSYHAIGTNAGISRASVQGALERFEETGGFQHHHTCGRVEKLNQQNHDNARLHTSKQTQAKLHELHVKALK